MLAIFNSLNAHNLLIFQPILMILVSKLMVHRALFDKIYLSLGLMSPLSLSQGSKISPIVFTWLICTFSQNHFVLHINPFMYNLSK